jgi:hypothetical protein
MTVKVMGLAGKPSSLSFFSGQRVCRRKTIQDFPFGAAAASRS